MLRWRRLYHWRPQAKCVIRWRRGRVAEGGALLRRYTRNCIEGSNPSVSATYVLARLSGANMQPDFCRQECSGQSPFKIAAILRKSVAAGCRQADSALLLRALKCVAVKEVQTPLGPVNGVRDAFDEIHTTRGALG
jgi:hypothetical protein